MQENRGAQVISECKEQKREARKDKVESIDDMGGCHDTVPPFT